MRPEADEAGSSDGWATPDLRPELSLAEALSLLGCVGVAVAGGVGLVLAQANAFRTPVVVLASVMVLVLVGGLTRAFGGLPRVRTSAAELALIGGITVGAAVLFFPGFPYAAADKDPGVYVAHAFAIEQGHSIEIHDEVWVLGETTDADVVRPGGGRFPGYRVVSDTTISSDFFHFVPAMLALALGLGGTALLFNITPAIGALSVLAVAAATRRAFGLPTAAVASLFLLTNMMQVWQAKTPSTEIVTQALFAGAVAAAATSVVTRWRGAAFLGGFLLAATTLVRPDAFIFVGFGAVFLCVAIALDRADGRVPAAILGALIVLPYAFHNAFQVQAIYVRDNGLPAGRFVAAVFVVMFVGALALREITRRTELVPAIDRLRRRTPQPMASLTLVVALVVMGVLAWNRESLWGPDFKFEETTRTLAERNMHWLSYFLTPLGFVLGLLGAAVLTWRRPWRVSQWIVLAPGLVLLPLYLYDARISPRLMWWVRRFVPGVLPALVVLMALAVVPYFMRRNTLDRVVAAVATLALTWSFLSMSLPLRDHREFAGSYDLAERIASETDGAGLVFFERWTGLFDTLRNSGSVVQFAFDRDVMYLPIDIGENEGPFFEEWAAAVDGPLYLVTNNTGLRDDGSLDDFEPLTSFRYEVPAWDESQERRPDHAVVSIQDLTVWRYAP